MFTSESESKTQMTSASSQKSVIVTSMKTVATHIEHSTSTTDGALYLSEDAEVKLINASK